jgi:DNA-directed RNA polymerase sigma subunit (sigma70/sigma32)
MMTDDEMIDRLIADSDTLEHLYKELDRRKSLRQAFKGLNMVKLNIYRERGNLNMPEIAKSTGYTKGRIKQILDKAISKVKIKLTAIKLLDKITIY